MQENGALEAARYEIAAAEPLQLRPPRRRFRAPHFTELVLRQLPDAVGSELRTTLDLPLNERVDAIIRDRLAQLRDHNVHNAAAVVIDNATAM
jgi:penicillin-binding protein 1C